MLQNVFNPVRRRLLQSLSAGLFSHGLGDLLSRQQVAAADAAGRCQARNVLVIYEEGGISQMDSWDPKPDAPVDHRSPYPPIATTVPGTFFSSLMPRVAQHAHRLSVVRSMTSTRVAGHIEGCLEFMKGYRFDSPLFQGSELRSHRFPDIGSVVTDQLGSERAELPGYILCPGANLPNHVGNAGFLPKSRAPWKLGTRSLGEDVAAPGWRVKSLDPLPGLDGERLRQRELLLNGLDNGKSDRTAIGASLHHNYERAFDLLTSAQVQRAFSFDSEKPETLDRYGRDHRGMCYLLGRKLIEADVRFVTVTVIQPSELVGRRNNGEPNGAFPRAV